MTPKSNVYFYTVGDRNINYRIDLIYSLIHYTINYGPYVIHLLLVNDNNNNYNTNDLITRIIITI